MKHASDSPKVAAVLVVHDRLNAAALAGDLVTLQELVSRDVVVSDPGNQIRRYDDLIALFQHGAVGYTSVSSTIDFAGELGDLVVLMGTVETVLKVAPPGAPWGPGTRLFRRFTDVFRQEEPSWRLVVRQSTVFKAE